MPSATVDELTEDVVLLDVREDHEWEAGHAVGALHIPMGEVPSRFGELPTGADVVVVCHVGGRSARVAHWLLEQGYPCRNLSGGMLAYAAAGRELASENGQPPRVD
ncbi:MAG TPA: rhodanese-like domain-containing protein [Mycobacteriales bacterium]|nr:rhodanese-like domain-containing protein [Mycobacteriales bacterium]